MEVSEDEYIASIIIIVRPSNHGHSNRRRLICKRSYGNSITRFEFQASISTCIYTLINISKAIDSPQEAVNEKRSLLSGHSNLLRAGLGPAAVAIRKIFFHSINIKVSRCPNFSPFQFQSSVEARNYFFPFMETLLQK